MSTSVRAYLRHILDETRYLMDQSQGLDRDRFLQDETLKRAFVRSLEVIGEAAKQIPDHLKQRHSHIQWRAMAGMRDRLIHGYFGVDYDVVWDAVTRNVPGLHEQISEILLSEDAANEF